MFYHLDYIHFAYNLAYEIKGHILAPISTIHWKSSPSHHAYIAYDPSNRTRAVRVKPTLFTGCTCPQLQGEG